MRHLLVLTALTLVPLAGCATIGAPTADTAPIRGDGLARIGEPTCVGSLVVTPQTLVEDSRCPMNARCIWAGRVVLTTRIDGPGWSDTRALVLGEPIVTHGARIALTSATPDKRTDVELKPGDYQFGFEGG